MKGREGYEPFMASILILSSFVAASRVGGGAQTLALARLGFEPILVPTVLFGRHPGRGAPGGGPVEAEVMAAMLEGIEVQGLFAGLNAVITGHFSSPEQVAVAARTLAAVRAANPDARFVVDPIMGDNGQLYVKPAVAEAIAAELVPLADLVAPNAWELERLTGSPITDPKSAVAAARSLGRSVLVSSVPAGRRIGVVYADERQAWLAAHPMVAAAPNGTGDLLTLLFAAALAERHQPRAALHLAAAALSRAVVVADGAPELPIEAFPTKLDHIADVALTALS